MGLFLGLWIFCLLASIVLGVVGIVFYFIKKESSKKVFQLAGISFSIAVASLIISANQGFLYTVFILTTLLTITLALFSLIHYIRKSGRAGKVFKITGVSCGIAILSLVLMLTLQPESTTKTTTQVSADKGKSSEEQPKEQVKKEEQVKQEAEAKKAEDAKKEAEIKKAEQAKKEAEEKKRKEAEAKKKEEQAKKEAEAKKKEELARKEAEAKKKEEQAKKEAEAKKKEEQAKKEAEAKKRKEEAAKAKAEKETFDMTVDDFKGKWLLATNREGLENLHSISNENLSNDGNIYKGQINDYIYFQASLDSNTKKIKDIAIVTIVPDETQDTISSDILLASGILLSVMQPELTADERGEISITKLGLGMADTDLSKVNEEYIKNDKTYILKNIDGLVYFGVIAGDANKLREKQK